MCSSSGHSSSGSNRTLTRSWHLLRCRPTWISSSLRFPSHGSWSRRLRARGSKNASLLLDNRGGGCEGERVTLHEERRLPKGSGLTPRLSLYDHLAPASARSKVSSGSSILDRTSSARIMTVDVLQ